MHVIICAFVQLRICYIEVALNLRQKQLVT